VPPLKFSAVPLPKFVNAENSTVPALKFVAPV
jgi:hypothetical protein